MKQFLLPFLTILVLAMGNNAEANGCTRTYVSSLVQLIPCRSAVATFSPLPPTQACCAAIRALGQPCFCALLSGPPVSGVDRNVTMELPDICVANFEPCPAIPAEN